MTENNNQNLAGRIPSQNIEAEQHLLGSLLIDKDAILKIADIINPEDFYKTSHSIIFEAIIELYSKHEPIDILSLSNKLEEKKQIDNVGGRSYLMQLSTIVSTASNVAHYAKIIQKKATLRRMTDAATLISELSFKEDDDIEILLDKAEQKLFGISKQYLREAFVPIKSVLEGAFERIDELHREKGTLRGIATGFTNLDNYLSGLQKSDLIILAAATSVGKTTLALDIARNSAKLGKAVGIFSLEMSKEQLVDRLICSEANIDLWKMRTGRLAENSDDFLKIGNALGTLSEIPLFIDDSGMVNIMEMRAKARRLQMEHGLDILIVDYLQLIVARNNKSENRVQEVAEISRGLKMLAKELNIPIVALAQLSRAVEANKPAMPKLSHLRESGSIEQDADVVLFIYRKSADRNYTKDEIDPADRNTAEIHIAKHRNGPTGEVKMFFDAERVTFKNLETRLEAPPAHMPTKTVEHPRQIIATPIEIPKQNNFQNTEWEPSPEDFPPPLDEPPF